MQVFAKKHAHDQQKTIWSLKIDKICRKNAISSSADPRHLVYSHLIWMYMYIYVIYTSAYICVYNDIFGGYRPVYNQYVIIVGYRGKIPGGHFNPIYLVLKPLKVQNSWRIFDRPVSSMYCKYAEYACKLQKNLPMTNNTCHNMQKNAISYYEYVEYAGIRPKNTLMISKKQTWSMKIDKVLEKWWKMQYRLCISPFLEVTILFNQHLHYRGEYGGKIPDGHSKPIYSVLKPLKLQNSWHIFRPSRVFHILQICRIRINQTNLSMNNKHCHDMQKNATSYSYFQNAEYTVFAKKHAHDQQTKTWSIKHDRILEKMQHHSVYNAVFGGYHPV